MSDQHSAFWELAGLESPRDSQASAGGKRTWWRTGRGTVLPLNRRFLQRAGVAAAVAVAAQAAVVLASTTMHLGAAATFGGLAVAVLGSLLPLARASARCTAGKQF